MNRFQEVWLNINAKLLNLLLLALGVIMVLLSLLFISEDSEWRTIVLSVGTSIVASSIVALLSARYLIYQSRVKTIIEKWGVEAIYENRSEINVVCKEYYKSLENELEIVAFGLRSFRDGVGDIIKRKVEKGIKVRILTIDPNSQILQQREKDENIMPGQTKREIQDLKSWMKDLKRISPNPSNVQLKYYDSLPLDFYFRIDDHLFIGPYLYNKISQQTITYQFKANCDGFKYYKNYFERLWNNNDFCEEPYDMKSLGTSNTNPA